VSGRSLRDFHLVTFVSVMGLIIWINYVTNTKYYKQCFMGSVTYQGEVPELVCQRGEELPFVRVVAVRGLEAPLADDNAVARTVALPKRVA
jgi:hypothetical protein